MATKFIMGVSKANCSLCIWHAHNKKISVDVCVSFYEKQKNGFRSGERKGPCLISSEVSFHDA